MDRQLVTSEQIAEALETDFQQLAKEIAEAMNLARAGSIIDDSEFPVFEANGKFRKQAFTKALKLVQKNHESFSPSSEESSQPRQTQDQSCDD